jgi:hypothetical protein
MWGSTVLTVVAAALESIAMTADRPGDRLRAVAPGEVFVDSPRRAAAAAARTMDHGDGWLALGGARSAYGLSIIEGSRLTSGTDATLPSRGLPQHSPSWRNCACPEKARAVGEFRCFSG